MLMMLTIVMMISDDDSGGGIDDDNELSMVPLACNHCCLQKIDII
jgi:hypothetical protein